MKAIQITMDEQLLQALDRDPEVKSDGRSAVLRRAAAMYLRQKRRRALKAAYAAAYGKRPGLGTEFNGWEDQGEWPADRA